MSRKYRAGPVDGAPPLLHAYPSATSQDQLPRENTLLIEYNRRISALWNAAAYLKRARQPAERHRAITRVAQLSTELLLISNALLANEPPSGRK